MTRAPGSIIWTPGQVADAIRVELDGEHVAVELPPFDVGVWLTPPGARELAAALIAAADTAEHHAAVTAAGSTCTPAANLKRPGGRR